MTKGAKTKKARRKLPTPAVVEKTFCLWLGPLRAQYARHRRENTELHEMWTMAMDTRAPHGAAVAAAKRLAAIIVHVVSERPRWDHHAVHHFNQGHPVEAFQECLDEEDGVRGPGEHK